MSETLLAVGTAKGLFLGRSADRRAWHWTGPHFVMQGVYSVAIDRRGTAPRILVGADSSHWGPSVFHSDDLGASWQEPPRSAVRFPESTGTSLERVWQLQPAGAQEPGWSTRAPNPPRCSAPPTAASRSPWSRACGSIRSGSPGARDSAARGCTRSWSTGATPTG